MKANIHASAGVYIAEEDRTGEKAGTTAPDTSVGSICIFAKQGPVDQVVPITGTQQMLDTFGTPDVNVAAAGSHYGIYCALEALTEMRTLLVTRVHKDARFGGLSVKLNSLPQLGPQGPQGQQGAQGTTVVTVGLESWTTGKFVDPYNPSTFFAKPLDTDIDATLSATTHNIDLFWVFGVDPRTSTSDYRVIISDVKGKTDAANPNTFRLSVVGAADVATSPKVLETFVVSLKQQLSGMGAQQFIEDVVNSKSKYIRVRANAAASEYLLPAPTGTPAVYSKDATDTHLAILKGGDSGLGFTSSEMADILNGVDEFPTDVFATPTKKISGWQLYRSKERVVTSILINGGYTIPAVQKEMMNVARDRQDAFAILDISSAAQGDRYDLTTKPIEYRTDAAYLGNADSTYGALYTPWYVVKDTFNNTVIQIPPSGHLGAIFARTDRTTAAWFAPAGIKRAYLNILDVGATYDQAARDLLVESQINPTRVIPNLGIFVWGDVTLQLRETVLSTISIRRLMLFLAFYTEITILHTVFDPLSDALKQEVLGRLVALLDPIKLGEGLISYDIICDKSNNTQDDADAGNLNIDIYLNPRMPLKRAYVRFILTRTGVTIAVVK
jgi:hypothetical protein